MGNNRILLKSNIQNDLQKKINASEAILSQLKDAIESVERNSTESKLELQENADSIQQRLTLRKLEITREIDLLCHNQINTLQEGISSTYRALGSLQSTLSHLDSFDHNQLTNLHVPDLLWMQNVTTPPALVTDLECPKLKEEIDNWGSVSAKSSKGVSVTDVVQSTSQRDRRPEREMMCHKSVSGASTSSMTFRTQPKLPLQNVFTEVVDNSNKTLFTSQRDCSSPEKWHLEQWLDEIKSDPNADDFEFVSYETERTGTLKNQETTAPTHEIEMVDGSNVTEDGSSIVCIDREDTSSVHMTKPVDSDLSQWLKPKKTPIIQATEEIVAAPVQIGNKRPNSATNSFLDFPCLRLDPNCWIREKKNKRCFNTELRISVSQKEIIPPTYALPNPFWLKRFCVTNNSSKI